MKFAKWYSSDNIFGWLLLAGIFNPDEYDKKMLYKPVYILINLLTYTVLFYLIYKILQFLITL